MSGTRFEVRVGECSVGPDDRLDGDLALEAQVDVEGMGSFEVLLARRNGGWQKHGGSLDCWLGNASAFHALDLTGDQIRQVAETIYDAVLAARKTGESVTVVELDRDAVSS